MEYLWSGLYVKIARRLILNYHCQYVYTLGSMLWKVETKGSGGNRAWTCFFAIDSKGCLKIRLLA